MPTPDSCSFVAMTVTRIGLLAVLCFLSIGSAFAAPSSRILEGDDANSGQYPWVVSVRLDNAHTSVGSIISDRHILTSAHGLSQLGSTAVSSSRVSVRVGSINQFAGGQIVSVATVHIHPSYGNFLHDVAIVTLSNALTFSDKIKKIDIVAPESEIAADAAVTVAGWGMLLSGASPYKLQHTELRLLSGPECELEAGYGYESVLCLKHDLNQGICRGDEGGPVMESGKLLGVVSFAFGSCGTKFPDVAGKVPYYYDWIQSIITK